MNSRRGFFRTLLAAAAGAIPSALAAKKAGLFSFPDRPQFPPFHGACRSAWQMKSRLHRQELRPAVNFIMQSQHVDETICE